MNPPQPNLSTPKPNRRYAVFGSPYRRVEITTVLALGSLLFAVLIVIPAIQKRVQDARRTPPKGSPELYLQRVEFKDLDGWGHTELSGILPVFLRSCDVMMKSPPSAPANPVEALGTYQGSLAGIVADWLDACEAARALQRTLMIEVPLTELHKPGPAEAANSIALGAARASPMMPPERTAQVRAFFQDHFQPLPDHQSV